MTLSTPVKIVVLAALALAVGLGGLMLVIGNRSSAATPPAPAPAAAHAQPVAVHHAPARPVVSHKRRPKVVLLPGMPRAIALPLLHHEAVVVAVYNSHTPGDRAAAVAARSGAHIAHAGFVAADVSHAGVANAIAVWSNSPMNPAVLVVRRPGRIVFSVAGPSDPDAVAQAVTSAR